MNVVVVAASLILGKNESRWIRCLPFRGLEERRDVNRMGIKRCEVRRVEVNTRTSWETHQDDINEEAGLTCCLQTYLRWLNDLDVALPTSITLNDFVLSLQA